MIEKFFKNPTVLGASAVLTVVILIAYIYDEKTNTKKDFFGLLKYKTPSV